MSVSLKKIVKKTSPTIRKRSKKISGHTIDDVTLIHDGDKHYKKVTGTVDSVTGSSDKYEVEIRFINDTYESFISEEKYKKLKEEKEEIINNFMEKAIGKKSLIKKLFKKYKKSDNKIEDIANHILNELAKNKKFKEVKEKLDNSFTNWKKERLKNKEILKSDVWVFCECGHFTYNLEYALTKKYNASKIKYSNGDPPTKHNIQLKPYLCKHLYYYLPKAASAKIQEIKDKN